MTRFDLAIPAEPGERSTARGFRRHLMPLTGVVFLALFAYSNALRGELVFDDVQQISDNPLVRNLGNYLSSSIGYRAMPNRYLAYLTFALNYRLGQYHVAGYHAFNLGVHVLSALLVYALVLLSFRTPRLQGSSLASAPRSVAFVASALFATHPIQTQAVTYVVQRITSLASFFYLLTVVLYVWWRLARESGHTGRTRSATVYALLLLTAIAAMKTKEISFTLPFVIILYELSFFGPGAKSRVLPLLPVLATACIIPLTLLNLHKPIGEALSDMSAVTRVQATVSRLDYLTTQAAVVATYLRLLVFPVDQNLDHDFPIYRSFLAPRVAGSVALLLGLAALATYLYWRTAPGARRPLDPGARLISFGIAWFFVTLAVESSVIPIVDIIYEHRVYLPSVGLFAATATACALLLRGISRENPARATVLAGILVALLLAALTLERNAVWADGVSLWTDAAEKSPGKSRPHCNLGTALAAAARPGEAASELRRAVDIDPGSSYARAQLGAVLLTLGRPAEAEPELREAIRLQPKDPEAIFNLAMMLWNTRRSPESKVWFKRFLEVSPSSYVDARRIAAARANR